jgi:GntR family transcriptional regulator/MocR family aminotransferase
VAVVSAARARSIGLYGMSSYRPSAQAGAPQEVLGFGDLSESAIERGIAAIADLT